MMGFYMSHLRLRCETSKPHSIIPYYPCAVVVTSPLLRSPSSHTSAASASIEEADTPSKDPHGLLLTYSYYNEAAD